MAWTSVYYLQNKQNMMYPYITLVLLIGLIQFSAAITRWRKEDYPNPVVNPRECRRPGISQPRVCDPNELVQKDDLNKLDEKIKDIKRSTLCQCGPVMCNEVNAGFSVSIAIMEQMKRDYRSENTNNGKLLDARVFTEYLGRRSWNFSRCEDDVIIFYSKIDNVLYIATGKRTQKKLTDDIVHEIVLIHQREFPENIFNGLVGVLDKIKGTLRGEWPVHLPQRQLPDPPEDHGPRGVASQTRISSTTILGVSTVLVVALFN